MNGKMHFRNIQNVTFIIKLKTKGGNLNMKWTVKLLGKANCPWVIWVQFAFLSLSLSSVSVSVCLLVCLFVVQRQSVSWVSTLVDHTPKNHVWVHTCKQLGWLHLGYLRLEVFPPSTTDHRTGCGIQAWLWFMNCLGKFFCAELTFVSYA